MILLDTHVWIWWVSNPDLLSSQADTLINKAMVVLITKDKKIQKADQGRTIW